MLVTVNKTFTIRVSVEVVPTEEAEAQVVPEASRLSAQPADLLRPLRNRVNLTVEDIRSMRAQGISNDEIARQRGCHVSTIYAKLKNVSANDRFKSIREHMRPSRFRRFIHILRQKEDGKTIAEIAKAEKCSAAAIVKNTKDGKELARKFKVDLSAGLSVVDDKPVQLFTLGSAKV